MRKAEGQLLVNREALYNIVSILANCFNALSYYLDDDFSAGSAPTGLVEILCHRHMVFSLNYTLVQLSSKSEARLACLRVLSCLSEWRVSIDALMNSDIAVELVRICADDSEAVLSANSGMRPPAFERSSTGGTSIASGPRHAPPEDDAEEVGRRALAAAAVAQVRYRSSQRAMCSPTSASPASITPTSSSNLTC